MLVVVAVAFLTVTAACKPKGDRSGHGDAGGPKVTEEFREAPWVDLTGEFRRIVKPVRGRADVVYRDGKYQLCLTGVKVEADGPLRVYLVGEDDASTTRLVTESKLVYDMAPLENGATDQVIDLPSRPDDRLRSVVLWQQAFAINLAVAPLRPTPQP